jgi:hypothetical protein
MKISQRCIEFIQKMTGSFDNLLNNSAATDSEAIEAVSKAMTTALRDPTYRERIGSYVRNSYLSGISTQVVNLVNQIGQTIMQPVLRASRGQFGEAGAMLEGITTGFMEAFPRFVSALKTRPINLDFTNQTAFDITKNKTADAILTFPTRMTGALDEAFSAVLERMEFNALRYRVANKFPDEFFRRNNTTREAFVKEIEEIALGSKKNPLWLNKLSELSPELHQQLTEFKMFNVFRSRLGASALDQMGKMVSKAKETTPELNLVVPFVTTPINVVKEAGGYVPGLGMLRVRQAKLDIKTLQSRLATAEAKLLQATNPDTQARFAEKAARIRGEISFKESKIPDFYTQQLMGAGFMMSTYSMVKQGLITGHYSNDPAERQRQITSKIPPMSIKIGDQWISYARVEPVATIMGIVTDTMQAYKEKRIKNEDMAATDVAKIVGLNLTDKTFTEGLSKLFLAFQEPDRYLESFMVSMTNPVVPTLVAQISKLEDDIKREVRDPDLAAWTINNLKSRIPGLRGELPAQVNLVGQEQDLGTLGGSLTGFNVAPVEREVVNQMFDNPYLKVTRTTRSIGGLELTGEQYATLEKEIGDYTYNAMSIMANNPAFMGLSRPLQANFIKGIITDIRSAVRLKALGELVQDPELRAQYILNEQAKYGAQPDVLED